MEVYHNTLSHTAVKAVLLDWDGTVSTLRYGWEQVMKPLMVEMITGGQGATEALSAEIDAYIDESTGIQTIHQMKWLAEQTKARGMNPDAPDDPWWYKGEYNRRLMEQVKDRLTALQNGSAQPEDFRIAGSAHFLMTLHKAGIKLYVASGTDDPDVKNEVAALGLMDAFTQIAGAPIGSENCSKEKVIAQLMADEGLKGDEFAVIGDGKVEIRLGREAGARTIGLASNEETRTGINPVKRERLIKAGADVICGDFTDTASLMRFLGLEREDESL